MRIEPGLMPFMRQAIRQSATDNMKHLFLLQGSILFFE